MSVTLTLVILTSLVSFNAFNNPAFKARLIFNPYIIVRNKDYKRFITSGFIHADFIHLLFNMLVLWMFGSYVERVFVFTYGDWGAVFYIALYILGIIVSDIPSFLKNKDLPHYNALGASGGVSSIVFSYILFDPASKLYLYGLIGLPGVVWAVLYIIYSYHMSKQQRDNINHDAHLYGGLFGIVFTILTVPNVISNFIEQLANVSLF